MSDWRKTADENPDFKCRECGSNDVEYRDIESDEGHDDTKYHCCNCGRTWWVEGSDY